MLSEEDLKELLWSLAWCDCTQYHYANVKRILAQACPGVDFTESIKQHIDARNNPPGRGCPR